MGRRAAKSPRKIAALRSLQEQRLRDQFEGLVAQMEAASAPVDYPAVEKRAKALTAVLKAMKDIYHSSPARGEETMSPETLSGTIPENIHDDVDDAYTGPDALDAWQIVLERKLDRLAESKREAAMAAAAYHSDQGEA